MPDTPVFTASHVRRASRWLKRHPDVRWTCLKMLQRLAADPYHPSPPP